MEFNPIKIIRDFISSSQHVMSVSYKPTTDVFMRTVKVVLLGTILVGLLGFIIATIINLIITV